MSYLGAGVVVFPGLAVVGMGVLVAQGVMWCGAQLQEHYESACREWTALMDAAWREHLRDVTELPDVVKVAMQRSAEPGANLALPGAAGGTASAELAALLEEARAARFGPDGGGGPDVGRQARLAAGALRERPDAAGRWLARRAEVVRLQGLLVSLDTMRREMAALALADVPAITAVGQRIAAATLAADALLDPAAVESAGPARLAAEVRELEADVFGLARRGQRDRVATAIAGTLRDLGYGSPDGDAPAVAHNGDFASVAGLRAGRAVAFDVTLDGEVTYDLSGHVGDACAADAQELFDALRRNGIVILDGVALERLEASPDVPAETLARDYGIPAPPALREQAVVTAQLLDVMDRMGFDHVTHHAAGGTIDIEGFNGPIGYRVVVPPSGRAEVSRQGADVTGSAADPVAAAAAPPAAQAADAAAVADERRRVGESLRRQPRRRSLRAGR
jgi:hypothetical protein